MNENISKDLLVSLYCDNKLSYKQISQQLSCTVYKVEYWIKKYNIQTRSRSEATYLSYNPNGDPFKIPIIDSFAKARLFGFGIGLYWGEGNKLNKYSVKLGNTDPEMIKIFIKFLIEIFEIDTNKLKYSLQIFSDVDIDEASNFWTKELNIDIKQLGKITVTPARSIGNYRKKNKYGVLIVYFHNRKLRDIIVSMCRDSSVAV